MAGRARWRRGAGLAPGAVALSPRRRGISSLLAMLFLMIFSTVALGFYASVTTATQVSKSESDVADSLLASESGMGFVRYHLANLNLPYGTTQGNLLNNVATCLARGLDDTANMGPYKVVVDAGTIYLPSRNDWVTLDRTRNTRFRALITQASGTTTLVVSVRGAAGDSAISRGVGMSFKPRIGSYSLAGINGINMSAGAFTDSYDSSKGPYSAATAGKRGTIVSNGNITLTNTARVNGDARPGPGKAVTIKDSAVVTGKTLAMPTTIQFPSVTLPATYTSLGAVNRNTGVQNIPGGVYVIDSLNLSGDAVINWLGPVTIYVRYSYSVSGNVVINSYQNKPSNRTLYFLPTCATATWTGTNVCVGELYAPDTDFYISGSVQKLGRITARTITNSSTGGMHSDDSMNSPGGSGDYSADVSTYQEVQ